MRTAFRFRRIDIARACLLAMIAAGSCAIAGADKTFVPAEATIDGETVAVKGVDAPQAVRYCFASFVDPPGTLENEEGLPASPFRTDDWPLE